MVLAGAALLAGCSSGRVEVNAGTTLSTGGTPSAGSSVTGSRTGLHVRSGNSTLAGVLVIMGLLAAGAEYNSEERPFPDPRALVPGNTEAPAPLAPDRVVNEQDCSKPVHLASGNLKCR